MRSFLSMKVVRLLLSINVSIWMAGGCLFGCSSNAVGSELESEAETMVVAGDSCHAARSHDCCTAQESKPQVAKKSKPSNDPALPSLAPTPRGMMKDCPLVVNATAVTAKSSGHVPDPGRAQLATAPFVENRVEQIDTYLVVPFLPNRGPTHVLYCVFLI
jgi:hypothetical protein